MCCRRARRIDEYAYENLGTKFENTPWVMPSVEKAWEKRKTLVLEGVTACACTALVAVLS